jgi:hypothetical protein
MTDAGIELVSQRTLIEGTSEVRFRLRPGDRPLVRAGDTVVPGTRIVERLRDAHVVEVAATGVDTAARPGDRWLSTTADPAAPVPPQPGLPRPVAARPGQGPTAGELIFESGGRWRLAAGEHVEQVETPVAGVVRDVRPGIGITLLAEGRLLRGVEAHGDPTRGVLAVGAQRGEHDGPGLVLRHGSLDVGLSGSILVVGSRIDAESLTRARAMGLRGIIVAGLAGKERRDFIASEGRQRAALHRLPTFAVLVLDGAFRRPIASPVAAVLQALAGREVAIVTDPPGLIFNEPDLELTPPQPDLVRVRGGEHAGREGRWEGLAGLRRFVGGSFLEAGWVHVGGPAPVAVPLADLERFA